MMDANKTRAYELARAWWESNESQTARMKGFAICDRCEIPLAIGNGYLCKPLRVYYVDGDVVASPDLICETCFDNDLAQAWDDEIDYSNAFPGLAVNQTRRKWWQFWK